jgi:transglutaminase-like putative cysteine protease
VALIDVVHTTSFLYEESIEETVMEAWLEPRNDVDQRRYHFVLEVQPRTAIFSYRDGFANTVHCFSVLPPHQSLIVTARSRVETLLNNPFAPPERLASVPDAVQTWPYLQFGGPVLQTVEVLALAEQFRPHEPEQVWDTLRALMHYIHETFIYEKEVTTVTSTVEDLLAVGKGVCQDFAHLMIAVCRAMNLPARYVSGYIVSRPDRDTRGSAASHAWCEALVPGIGWRGFDPTNDLLATDGHVKVGIGRNYHDVPPTRGTYRGAARKEMRVEVETTIIDSVGS